MMLVNAIPRMVVSVSVLRTDVDNDISLMSYAIVRMC